MSTCLGIDVIKRADGTWTLTQPFFIDIIIQALGLNEECRAHDTHTIEILSPDNEGAPFNENWHYRSVLGILTYVASSSIIYSTMI